MERDTPDPERAALLRAIAAWLLSSPILELPSLEAALAAADAAYARLRTRFSSTLGVLGFEAIWSRAVHLAVQQAHLDPRLPAPPAVAAGASGLRALVAELPPTVAHDVLAGTLSSFFTILVTLLGEPLTLRILQQIWPALPLGPPPGSPATKEHHHD
jgi:hypothetical protein